MLGRGAGPSGGQHARHSYGHRPRAARSLLDSASWQHETGPWGTQPPHHQTGNADTEPGAPTQQPNPSPPGPTRRDHPRPLDKRTDISAVQRAIAAGNLIHTRPYPEPDVHYGTLAVLWSAYDCSGATSFVLYAAGLLGSGALNSTGLESYGLAGPGQWITVYANSAHAWIVVAGIAFDTADYGGPPIPAGSGPRWRAEPLANLGDGSAYVVRHPPGL